MENRFTISVRFLRLLIAQTIDATRHTILVRWVYLKTFQKLNHEKPTLSSSFANHVKAFEK